MNIIKHMRFGDVEAWKLGFGPVGPPIMSVHMYLVDGLLIDTGQRNMRKHVMRLLRDKKIRNIALTHHHEDHSANAAILRKHHGAVVYAHHLARRKMRRISPILPYQHLMWGRADAVEVETCPSVIKTPRYVFIPVHTPGHGKDHTVYLEQRNGRLFSGDLYLGDRIKYFRSDERITEQIASLDKVLQLDFDALFCGHRPTPSNGKTRIRQKLRFLVDIHGRIRDLYIKGYTEKAIIRRMRTGEDRFAKWLTMGNVSFANLVRSVTREL